MIAKINPDEARALLERGLTDTAIAKHFGVTQSGVTRWRNRNGLQPNRPHPGSGRLSAEQQRKARKLLREGATKEQVSREVGIAKDTVMRLRKQIAGDDRLWAHGRTLSGKRDALRRAGAALLQEVSDAARYVPDPVLRDDVIGDMVLAMFEGRLARERIRAEVRTYSGRAYRRWQSRWGPASLDEELGDGGFSLGDFLPCPQAAAWLESVGA